MLTTGEYIKNALIEAGDAGCCIADLHKWRKENLELRTWGTYQSFVRFFRWLIQLGWVERTGKTEVAYAKGNGYELASPKTFYRITSLGIAADLSEWNNPRLSYHPEYVGIKRKNYHKPTGRPRGRPRASGSYSFSQES